MRAELFLSHRYIKAHKKQSITITLITALFIAALSATLIYRQSYQITADNRYAEQYGRYAGVVYNADTDRVNDYEKQIKETASGITYVTEQVGDDDGESNLYLGYMDSNAAYLYALKMLNGRMPENSGEIAIESATYTALSLSAEVGEKVTIPVVRDGKTIEKEYLLVGIIDNYIAKWQRFDSSKKSLTSPPPALLTVPEDGSEIKYIHVICSESARFYKELNGEYSENRYINGTAMAEQAKANNDRNIIPVFGIFAAVMIFGISSIFIYTFRERRKYINLLRCIGLKKRKGIGLFFIQAVELILASCIVGSVLAVILSYCVILISRLLGNNLEFALNFSSFWMAWLIAGVTVLAIFTLPLFLLFRKSPLSTVRIKSRRIRRKKAKAQSVDGIWQSAAMRNYKIQNLFSVILTAVCMFVAVYGYFSATFSTRSKYYSVLNETSYDYKIYITAGSSSAASFHVLFPRNMGISQKSVDSLYNMEGVEIVSAYMDHTISNFFLFKANDDDPFLAHLLSDQRDITSADSKYFYEAMEAIGGGIDDILAEPDMRGMSYDIVVSSITINNGSVDKEKFISGKEIIAPDVFNVGDTFTMVTPVVTNGAEAKYDEIEFEYVVTEVTVGATYHGDYGYNSKFIVSAEYMSSIDSATRYEMVVIKNTKPNDKTVKANIENALTRILANSPNTSMANRPAEIEAYYQTLIEDQIQLVVSIALFVILIVLAIALSTYVKVRTSMHSYMLMRAVGANKKTILQLIKNDCARLLLTGGIVGTILGFAASILYLRDELHVECPTTDIFVVMAVISVCVCALLYFLTVNCIKRPVMKLLDANIVESVNSVDL